MFVAFRMSVRRAFGLCDVGDELEEAAVGIAEVNADTASLGAAATDRPFFDLDTAHAQVRDSGLDRVVPLEA